MKILNDNNIMNMSMSSNFSLFSNPQFTLSNSLVQSSETSNFSASNVSLPSITASNVSESVQPSTDKNTVNTVRKGKKEEGKKDDKKKEFGKREFSKPGYGKKDFSQRNEKKIDLTVEKRYREDKPDRKREIVDTFFFL